MLCVKFVKSLPSGSDEVKNAKSLQRGTERDGRPKKSDQKSSLDLSFQLKHKFNKIYPDLYTL